MRPDPILTIARHRLTRYVARPGVWLVAALCIFSACVSAPPALPQDDAFEWTTHSNPSIGFALQIPDIFAAEQSEDGRFIRFRWHKRTPMKIRLIGPEEGRHRGLWFGHESEAQVALGGRAGRLYRYTHCDGPFCSRMVAFVAPHRVRQLALEFQLDGELPPVYRHILDSFTWTAPE